jgi:hypothetical protein
VLNGWSFPVRSIWVAGAAAVLGVLLVLSLVRCAGLDRLVVPSAVAALGVYFVMNASFFPELSRYQIGSRFTREALSRGGDAPIYFVDKVYPTFQFYSGRLVPAADPARIRAEVDAHGVVLVVANESGRRSLEAAALPGRVLLSAPDCRITMLQPALLDPSSRSTACARAYLLEFRR